MSHRNWKDAEEETMAARALVDARYLQLQNVMFEKVPLIPASCVDWLSHATV